MMTELTIVYIVSAFILVVFLGFSVLTHGHFNDIDYRLDCVANELRHIMADLGDLREDALPKLERVVNLLDELRN
jgi:hypothetical protein